jgi:hypothetical protein
MALVFFRSRAASEIIMVAENAQRLLEILGRPPSERGVIRAGDLASAIALLSRAVEADRASEPGPFADEGVPAGLRTVTLSQRAFPLLDMMRAAHRRQVDVTWGI